VRSDTRCATATLLAALTTGLSAVREPKLVRERFEEEVRHLINARSIVFRDDPPDRLRPHVVSLDIPGRASSGRVRLEASFESARAIDDRTRELLDVAVQVAGLLFEIERVNGRWPLASAQVGMDGAAPLIGSSEPIRRVRERIEKIAGTDFTVLIEGAIGPQPHRDYVEVSGPTTVGGGEGKVEGAGEDAPAPEGAQPFIVPTSLGRGRSPTAASFH
jgi:hypothetical protein